jgi:hypothetical protein
MHGRSGEELVTDHDLLISSQLGGRASDRMERLDEVRTRSIGQAPPTWKSRGAR